MDTRHFAFLLICHEQLTSTMLTDQVPHVVLVPGHSVKSFIALATLVVSSWFCNITIS